MRMQIMIEEVLLLINLMCPIDLMHFMSVLFPNGHSMRDINKQKGDRINEIRNDILLYGNFFKANVLEC